LAAGIAGIILKRGRKVDYKAELTEFIRKEILSGRNVSLQENQDLLSAGIIDSLGILRLVAFMEKQLGIQVPDEDVVFENFQNIQVMSDYVAQRKQAS